MTINGQTIWMCGGSDNYAAQMSLALTSAYERAEESETDPE